ncbi:hypothetical protein SLEP1_g52482 [Rubroshorea leprosula]|uniref:Uncharacterized protein n=1 Tax=Rubroshorea leprosula TaxID=152421 RepID=A0AAV5M6E4_9ROSI|nr:hypothetical protein SLEP1_g52482 [Rubroshorea leprosula]
MFCARNVWSRFSTHVRLHRSRLFCGITKNNSKNNSNGKAESNVSTYDESYRQLDNLNFVTAAKMLFTDPPKKKKFGFDFHLVQLFFACLPSLAVYLVAQYARYEIRRMEAELEQKKKQEEEENAKEAEQSATEEKEADSNPELSEVKVRLEKLEEAVKEIVVESRKEAAGNVTKNQQHGNESKRLAIGEPSDSKSKSEPSRSLEQDQLIKQKSTEQSPSLEQSEVRGSTPVSDASHEDQKGNNQKKGPTQDSKK